MSASKDFHKWLFYIEHDREYVEMLINYDDFRPIIGGALDTLFAFADEQDETKPCTCGQADCPFPPPISEAVFAGLKEDAARDWYDEGPRPFGIVGGEVMEFGPQAGQDMIF